MKIIIFLLLILSICWGLAIPSVPGIEAGKKLELVKVISDDEEQDDYFFSHIEDAILTPCKDIIILDSSGVAVSRYNWNGNLIKRLNKKGKGPGDFLWPSIVCRTERKLYIYDDFNRRVVESGLHLENLKCHKMPDYPFMKHFEVIGDNKFVVNYSDYKDPYADKIFFVDKKGEATKSFFPHTPVKITDNTKKKRMRLAMLSTVNYGFDDKRERMLIGFDCSANPIDLYLYDIAGKQIKKFSFPLEKKYQFSYLSIESDKRSQEIFRGKNIISVQNISYYNNHWYVFVYLTHFKDIKVKYDIRNRSQYVENSSFYLKYDAEGKLVGRFDLDSYFKCFHISKEGYVLGKHPDSEMEELVIYKIVK